MGFRGERGRRYHHPECPDIRYCKVGGREKGKQILKKNTNQNPNPITQHTTNQSTPQQHLKPANDPYQRSFICVCKPWLQLRPLVTQMVPAWLLREEQRQTHISLRQGRAGHKGSRAEPKPGTDPVCAQPLKQGAASATACV